MRRELKEKYPVEKYNPWFFWKECEKCGSEFRREKGFRYVTFAFGCYDYICSNCAPSMDSAIKLYLSWKKNLGELPKNT